MPGATDPYAWKSLCSVLRIFKCGSSGIPDDPSTLIGNSGASGEFTVKEGYRHAYRWKQSKLSCRGASDSSKIQAFWKSLWRTGVPDRVKILVWRLYYHAIPLYKELNKRGFGNLKECCFCGYKGETVEHLFFQCWWSMAYWGMLEL